MLISSLATPRVWSTLALETNYNSPSLETILRVLVKNVADWLPPNTLTSRVIVGALPRAEMMYPTAYAFVYTTSLPRRSARSADGDADEASLCPRGSKPNLMTKLDRDSLKVVILSLAALL